MTIEEKIAKAPRGYLVFIRGGLVRYASRAAFDKWLARMQRERPKMRELVLEGIRRIQAGDETAFCPCDGIEQDLDDPRKWTIDITNPRAPRVRLVGPVLS